MAPQNPFTIALIGPESTGKSVLTEQLAAHFKVPFVLEYARSYVANLPHRYTIEDLCAIAQKQIALEREVVKTTAPFVLLDTEMIINKVWFEHVYKQIPDFVTEYINDKPADFYLLCAPDIPWMADEVRENGELRNFFFEWYKHEIETTGKPYEVVVGSGAKRLNCAIKQIEMWLSCR